MLYRTLSIHEHGVLVFLFVPMKVLPEPSERQQFTTPCSSCIIAYLTRNYEITILYHAVSPRFFCLHILWTRGRGGSGTFPGQNGGGIHPVTLGNLEHRTVQGTGFFLLLFVWEYASLHRVAVACSGRSNNLRHKWRSKFRQNRHYCCLFHWAVHWRVSHRQLSCYVFCQSW